MASMNLGELITSPEATVCCPRRRSKTAETAAVQNVLNRTHAGDEVTLLATYTATLALRHTLSAMGFAKEFWED